MLPTPSNTDHACAISFWWDVSTCVGTHAFAISIRPTCQASLGLPFPRHWRHKRQAPFHLLTDSAWVCPVLAGVLIPMADGFSTKKSNYGWFRCTPNYPTCIGFVKEIWIRLLSLCPKRATIPYPSAREHTAYMISHAYAYKTGAMRKENIMNWCMRM